MLPSFSLTSDLARRIWVTLGALLVYRLGAHLPLPGIDADVFARLLSEQTGVVRAVVGSGATARLSILALGVMPYVSSCLVVHLIATFYAPLRALRRQGPQGWARFNQYVRVGAAILAAIQGYGVAVALASVPNLVPLPGPLFVPTVVVSLVAGTMLLIWLGEQIFSRGLTDGVWLLFVAGTLAGAPADVAALVDAVRTGAMPASSVLAVSALFVGLVALIVLVERAERRLHPRGEGAAPVAVLRLNTTGMLGPLAAGSALPLVAFGMQSAAGKLGWGNGLMAAMLPGGPFYIPVYALLIILFVVFFTRRLAAPSGQPDGAAPEVAERQSILMRLALIGALYLAALSIVPQLILSLTGFPFFVGGMALMVMVLLVLNGLDRIKELAPGALGRAAQTP